MCICVPIIHVTRKTIAISISFWYLRAKCVSHHLWSSDHLPKIIWETPDHFLATLRHQQNRIKPQKNVRIILLFKSLAFEQREFSIQKYNFVHFYSNFLEFLFFHFLRQWSNVISVNEIHESNGFHVYVRHILILSISISM